MKPIRSRAKVIDVGGGWVKGYPVELSGHTYLYFRCFDSVLTQQEVFPETLCACTGQLGEGDEPIYENDIVFDTFDEEFGVVEWDEYNSRFIIQYQGCIETFAIIDSRDLRIVGNTFDDPDLVPWYKQ